jgi:hypothetical protein
MSLINEALLAKGKPTLGFINPMIYKIAASNSKAFYGTLLGRLHGDGANYNDRCYYWL